MKRFKNILFVVNGDAVSDQALKLALSLAMQNQADLSFMVLHPAFPQELENAKGLYEKAIKEDIKSKLKENGLVEDSHIFFESSSPHFVAVIQQVIRNDFDLVIKAAESLGDEGTQDKGFKSLDMSLLRKCPCPVWLCRVFYNNETPRVLTAIDPVSETPEGRDLNLNLLQTGDFLAKNLGGIHDVISCWDFEEEGFLRHSAFLNMEAEKVDALVIEAEQEHRLEVEKCLEKAGIDRPNTIICQRGEAYKIIPEYVQDHQIDRVVMGTVARTGIPGFIIGNTAENILQNLSCGLFAIKPNGFVSPIKAY